MSQAEHAHTTTCRTLLGAAAAAPLAALPVAAVAGAPNGSDAELLRLAAEFQRLHGQLKMFDNRPEATDPIAAEAEEAEFDEIHDAWWAAVTRMIDIPARTPAGLRAKAAATLVSVVHFETPGRGDLFEEVADDEMRLVASVLRDVAGSA